MNNPISRAAVAAWKELSTNESKQWFKESAWNAALATDFVARHVVADTLAVSVVAVTFMAGLINGNDIEVEEIEVQPDAAEVETKPIEPSVNPLLALPPAQDKDIELDVTELFPNLFLTPLLAKKMVELTAGTDLPSFKDFQVESLKIPEAAIFEGFTDYDSMDIHQLRDLCNEKGIAFTSDRKKTLIRKLKMDDQLLTHTSN